MWARNGAWNQCENCDINIGLIHLLFQTNQFNKDTLDVKLAISRQHIIYEVSGVYDGYF